MYNTKLHVRGYIDLQVKRTTFTEGITGEFLDQNWNVKHRCEPAKIESRCPSKFSPLGEDVAARLEGLSPSSWWKLNTPEKYVRMWNVTGGVKVKMGDRAWVTEGNKGARVQNFQRKRNETGETCDEKKRNWSVGELCRCFCRKKVKQLSKGDR